MTPNGGTVYDPDTITLLKSVLEDAWACLVPEQQKDVSKTVLAERLLKAAARGERDPQRLRVRALLGVAPPARKAS